MGNLIRKSKWMFALAASPLLFVLHTATAEVAVVSSPNFPADSLSLSQVKDIFLGKMTSLPEGTKITVIDHKDGDAVKDEFYDKVVGKTSSQLKAYWAKIIFTGEGFPPKAYSGDKAVKDHVMVTPGAIGYISAESVDKSVKVLFESK